MAQIDAWPRELLAALRAAPGAAAAAGVVVPAALFRSLAQLRHASAPTTAGRSDERRVVRE